MWCEWKVDGPSHFILLKVSQKRGRRNSGGRHKSDKCGIYVMYGMFQLTLSDIDEIEDSFIAAVLAMVVRLSENSFRPMYYKVCCIQIYIVLEMILYQQFVTSVTEHASWVRRIKPYRIICTPVNWFLLDSSCMTGHTGKMMQLQETDNFLSTDFPTGTNVLLDLHHIYSPILSYVLVWWIT